MDKGIGQKEAGFISAGIALSACVLFVLFVLHGRFSPTWSIAYVFAFMGLIALSLYKSRFTGTSDSKESVELLEEVMLDSVVDLRKKERGTASTHTPLYKKIITLLSRLRIHLSGVVQTLHQFTYKFYRMEREFGVFSRSFSSMIRKITQATGDGHKISVATETQYASSEEISATAHELARLSVDLNKAVGVANAGALSGSEKLLHVESIFREITDKIACLEKTTLLLSAQISSIQEAQRQITSDSAQDRQITTSLSELAESIAQTTNDISSASLYIKDADQTVRDAMAEINSILTSIQGVSSFSVKMASSAESLGESSEELSLSAETVSHATTSMEQLLTSIEADVNTLSEMLSGLTSVAQEGSGDAVQVITELRSIKVTTEEDFIRAGLTAVQAHRDWVIGLRKSIDSGIFNVETDSKRCRFGVFLSLVDCPESVPSELWDTTVRLHDKFHGYGHEAKDAVEKGDIAAANTIYEAAEALSKTLVKLIEQIITLCQKSLLLNEK